jgi:hypothetical protein
MSKHWFEYVKSCYDLVIESEGRTHLILEHEVEAYVVHLMARNFERTDIGNIAVSIQVLTALQKRRREELIATADECLLIHSFPLKRGRWPSETYYQDIGTTAYGMAGHIMEEHFVPAGQVINSIFKKSLSIV